MVLVSVALARLEPAAPEVERATLYIDSVTRGPFVREVRGNGSLVPEDIRWIPAITEGRVERFTKKFGAQTSESRKKAAKATKDKKETAAAR